MVSNAIWGKKIETAFRYAQAYITKSFSKEVNALMGLTLYFHKKL